MLATLYLLFCICVPFSRVSCELVASNTTNGADPGIGVKVLDAHVNKWWSNKKPSLLQSRLPHHERPSHLITNGAANFRFASSKHYYYSAKGARIIKWSHFMTNYQLGGKISLVCVAIGWRSRILWLKDGLEMGSDSNDETSCVKEWHFGNKKLKSKLEIDPAMPKDTGFYECVAENGHAVDSRGFIAKYELN